MICLIKDNTIVFGPTVWPSPAIREALYIAGYTEVGGQLHGPDDSPLMALPDVEPVSTLGLGHGYRLLPVVEIETPAPESKILAGRESTILEDRVELRPVWADIPPTPPAPPVSRTMTKYAFRTKVLTFAERVTMDNSVIPELVTMRNDLLAAEVVDLDEVAKYRSVMLATGLATEARINEIIAGVMHE